jgi:hypothetical protein
MPILFTFNLCQQTFYKLKECIKSSPIIPLRSVYQGWYTMMRLTTEVRVIAQMIKDLPIITSKSTNDPPTKILGALGVHCEIIY